MVTVVHPVYYEEHGTPLILGVVGIDVTLKSMERFGKTSDQLAI